MTRAELATLFTYFAENECRLYSPLYAAICASVAADDELLALVEAAPPPAHLPLVPLGAVHYLLLGGDEHPLGAVYRGESDADPVALFRDFALSHRDALLEVMAVRRTQTNEVARTAYLAPALEWVHRRHRRPLALIDVGASAGLNLNLDRYRIELDGRVIGPPDGVPTIECRATGDPPLGDRVPDIVARVGLDQTPVDVTDPDDARWLAACVWPDQRGRLGRLQAAIEVAQRHPPRVVAGDAVEGLPPLVAAMPDDALVCVTTTFVVAYFPPELRAAFEATLAGIGRDVVWIVADSRGVIDGIGGVRSECDDVDLAVMGAVSYVGGTERREHLARIHPHGEWIEWRGEA